MTPQPDFLQPVRGPHRLAWAACAVALLVLAVAALDARQAWLARNEAALPRAEWAAPRPAAPADTPRRRALRDAASQLARPWPALFAAVESAHAPGVAWLALDIGEQSSVRLEGLAPDAPSALAAAEAMRHDGAWAEVLVTRIDKAADGGQRFTIAARPREGAW